MYKRDYTNAIAFARDKYSTHGNARDACPFYIHIYIFPSFLPKRNSTRHHIQRSYYCGLPFEITHVYNIVLSIIWIFYSSYINSQHTHQITWENLLGRKRIKSIEKKKLPPNDNQHQRGQFTALYVTYLGCCCNHKGVHVKFHVASLHWAWWYNLIIGRIFLKLFKRLYLARCVHRS